MKNILLFLAVLVPAFVGAQPDIITAKRVRATQNLQIGADSVNSVVQTITSGSTHKQLPTAKAVYDYGQTITFTLVTTPTLSGAGTSGSPLTIAQQGATNGQPLEWNSSLGRWAPGTDDGTTYTGGTGISVLGTVISNTAPDQVVALTPGTGIGVSGTYPNFTLTNTGDTNASDDITGSGAANRIAYYSGTQTLASSSALQTNGTNVGIGTASVPSDVQLDVAGTIRTPNLTMPGAVRVRYITSTAIGTSGNTGCVILDTKIPYALSYWAVDLSYFNINSNAIQTVSGKVIIEGYMFSTTSTFAHGTVLGNWDFGKTASIRTAKNSAGNLCIIIGAETDGTTATRYFVDEIKGPLGVTATPTWAYSTNLAGDGYTAIASTGDVLRAKTIPFHLNSFASASVVNNCLQLGNPSGAADGQVGILFRASSGVSGLATDQNIGFVNYVRRITTSGNYWWGLRYQSGPDIISAYNTNRVGIGVASSPTARLQITGEGATSGTLSFLAENSAGTDALWALDNATVGIAGTGGTATSITGRDASNVVTNVIVGTGLGFTSGTLTNTGDTNGADDITTSTNAGGELTGTFGNLSIVPNAVTATKIASDAVTQAKMADNSVGDAELVNTTVTPGTYNFATIVVNADGRITAAGNGAVTNLYNVNGTLSNPRTVTMSGNLLTWNANALSNPDVFAIQGGSGITRAFIFQNNVGNPIGHISYRDTMATFGSYAGVNTRLQADAYSLELTRQGAVVIPDNTTPPAANKLGALTFNSNSNGLFIQTQPGAIGVERVATVQNDLTPNALNLITGAHTLSGKNWTSRADANAGAFTITLGAQLEEGRDYVVMCKRNGTNAVTFTAAAGYSLAHALDTALTSGNLVAGATGTGLAAPGNTYYIRRSGTIISIK